MNTKQETTKEKNLAIYEQAREVPQYALKTIGAGRLKGFSDVNPVYRIKRMTEIFGPCGLGWYYEVTSTWTETYGQEVKCFCNLNLYFKDIESGEWSRPIFGTGGSSLVEVNSKGTFVSDEAYKMALTDALSVAMKSLGIAADVYYAKDNNPANPGDSKYRQLDDKPADITAEAVAAMKAADSRATFEAVWNRYKTKVSIAQGSPFYNAALEMGKRYPKQKAS